MAKSRLAVGIDLGTTDSCVAVFRNNKVEIIANDHGNRTTPSYVAFTESELLVGEPAKHQGAMNPRNTIFDAKRLIGRRFTDPDLQAEIKNWPFQVISSLNRPKIQAHYENKLKQFTAEEISAMVLCKMKVVAEDYLGHPVTDAVVTVPAYFNNSQRQATKDACAMAGLNVLRLINEPTAAAITYAFNKKKRSNEENVLIFDIGGGTCNVSLVTIDNGIYEVKSTAGHTHLGGEDFDNRMVTHFVEEFRRKYKKDLTCNKRALRRLRTSCEKAKRTLSSYTRATIEIDSLMDNIDFYTTITRTEFEEMNNDLFRDTLEPVKKSIRDAMIDKTHIHEVVLIGGSTHIPKIQQLLQQFFSGKELYKSINPIEAVAYGAAIQAAILNGNKSQLLQDILLLDIIPFSLGITSGEVMTKVLQRNTLIPTKNTQTLTTDSSNFCVKIYEGERALVKDNYLLGEFELDSIPRSSQVEVTFDVDANSILKVTALAKKSGKEKGIIITNYQGCLDREEFDRVAIEFEHYSEQIIKQKSNIAAKNKLEAYCLSVKSGVDEDFKDKLTYFEGQCVMKKCNEVIEWLDRCDLRTGKAQYETKQKELEDYWHSIIINKLDVEVVAVFNNNNRKTDETKQTTTDDVDPSVSTYFVNDLIKCGSCRGYLSYFPIYIAKNQLPICGRCSNKVLDKDYIQDTLYESLVQNFKFPCVYDAEGCLERLLPAKVSTHENRCVFRMMTCPYIQCAWKGAAKTLLQHVKQTHSDSILQTNFELNFLESYNVYNFVIHKDELFGFRQKINFDNVDGVLECSLICYHVHNLDNQFEYEILVENGPRNLSVKYPSKSTTTTTDNITKIELNDVREKLRDPSTIIATINIFTSDNEKLQEKPKHINPVINYDLLSELECPICFDYITPPIYQCMKGHSICSDCKQQVLRCPSCQADVKDTQNFTLEKMAQLLIYPCRFSEQGCEFTSKPEKIKEHQKQCMYGPHKCPLHDYINCHWTGTGKNIFDHIINLHPDNLLELNTINLHVTGDYFEKENRSCYIIQSLDLLFKMHYLYKADVLYWAVQLIGASEEAKNYQFEIEIVDSTGKNQRMLMRKFCAPVGDKGQSFDVMDNYIYLRRDQVKSFCTDLLSYQIRIIR